MKNGLINLIRSITTAFIVLFAINVQAQDIPAGEYTIDPYHTSVLFRVSHLGFSMYTARFTRANATLHFNPDDLAQSTLQADVDTTSLETDFPFPEEVDFDKVLQGPDWLSTEKFPSMTFQTTKISLVGDNTMRAEGTLTMRGVTKPFTLEAKYNGGYAGHPLDKNARIGFSARGTLKRSDFDMTIGLPDPGTTFGVGDAVEIIIETEFSGPPWQQ